jgi:hypothetical protein
MPKYHKSNCPKLEKNQLNKKIDLGKAGNVFSKKVKIVGLISQIDLRLNRKKKIIIKQENQITKNFIKKGSCHS